MSAPWEEGDELIESGEWAPVAPTHPAKRFLQGAYDPIYGAAQIMDRVAVDPIRQLVSPGATNMNDVIRTREEAYQAPEGFDVARTLGNVASPMTLLAPTKGPSLLKKTIGGKAAAKMGAMELGAGTGAIQGALVPSTATDFDTFWNEKMLGAAMGTAVGGALPVGIEKMQNAGSHIAASPVGRWTGGKLAEVKQNISHAPAAGAVARSQLRKAKTKWQEDTRAAATLPGQAVPKTVQEVGDAISREYNERLANAAWKQRPSFDSDTYVGAAAHKVDGVTPKMMEKAKTQIAELMYMEPEFGGPIAHTPQTAHFVEARLGKMANKFRNSQDPQAQIYGELLGESKEAFSKSWRQLADVNLTDLDAAWRNYVPIKNAALHGTPTLVSPEDYTPRMLLQATRKNANDRAFLEGTAAQQQLGKTGEELIGSAPLESSMTGLGLDLLGGVGTAGAGTGLINAAYLTPPSVKWLMGKAGKPQAANAVIAALRGTPYKQPPQQIAPWEADDEVIE